MSRADSDTDEMRPRVLKYMPRVFFDKFPPDRPVGLPKGTALSWNAHKAARFFIILKKKVYNTGEYSHCYMMHTRAVRQMLP